MSTNPGGVEGERPLLFADIRGWPALLQELGTTAFSRLINRFYIAATHVFSESNAWIERLVGDQVIGLYLPAMAGNVHARVSIQAAHDLLHAVVYGGPSAAWLPFGGCLHAWITFIGVVCRKSGMPDITWLATSA